MLLARFVRGPLAEAAEHAAHTTPDWALDAPGRAEDARGSG